MPPRYRYVRTIAAPVEEVWALLTDHARYAEFTPVPTSRLVRPGRDDPNGVGAIRHLGIGPLGTREQVLVSEPPHHLAYTVVRGMPVRDYRADVHLQPDADGTRMVYEGSFEPLVPGTGPLLRVIMTTAVRTLIASLVRQAERDHAS